MSSKKVVVLGAQVPFIRGGAERLNDSLVKAINDRLPGVEAELVQLPFKWYPETQLLKDMAAWRLVDLSESNGHTIDLCIATKYPTYLARHPNKITWLVHQHRVFYDLEGSEFDVPHDIDDDKLVRKKVRATDGNFLAESKDVYTISSTVSDRLLHYNNMASVPVYPPPELAEQITPGSYGDYILYVGRVERIKRIEPLIAALTGNTSARAVIVGTGEHLPALQAHAVKLGVADRCTFEGYVSNERYLSLLSGARAVYYAPIDEDYGFATVEALLARKPVVTLANSGEVRRIVESTGAGFVAASGSEDIMELVNSVMTMSETQLAELAEAGHNFARGITWENVLNILVEPYL
jgi:glycosyltransferase involved in cell wall biosynthesis